MSRCRNLLLIGVAGILVGCSDQEAETSVPATPQPAAAAPAAVSVEAPAASVLLPSGASVPATPPPGIAAAIPRSPDAPIVEGSAQDPNVLPPGFVPKPPALEYVKNGQPNLEALSEALQVYCMWKKEVPANLEALVTSKFLPSLPPAPAGKKYGIDSQNLTVVLVN
jgi:hypothetical protein